MVGSDQMANKELEAMISAADWTEAELWVWDQIANGKVAYLNLRGTHQAHLDPNNQNGWNADRRLSVQFLQTILTDKPFVEATPYAGVRILGALIDDAPLNLEHARLSHTFWLELSRILVDVKCRNLRVDGELSFEACYFAGDVSLNRAVIAEDIILSASTFDGDVNLNGIAVTDSAFLRNKAAFKGRLDLGAAKIGLTLELNGSTFERDVSLNSVVVAGSALLRDKANFKGCLDLRGAKIGSSLDLSRSTFEGKIELSFAKIDSTLELQHSIFLGPILLHGCTISGALMLGISEDSAARWEEGASIALLN